MSLTHAAVSGLILFALAMVGMMILSLILSLIPLWIPAIGGFVAALGVCIWKGWF